MHNPNSSGTTSLVRMTNGSSSSARGDASDPRRPFGLTEKANFPAMPIGNDPFPNKEQVAEIKEILKRDIVDGKFIFVGPCGLLSINWILLIVQNQFEHIPQLYLIDYSDDVKTFWNIIKKIMKTADNHESLKNETDSQNDALLKCCKTNPNPKDLILEFFSVVIKSMIEQHADLTAERIYEFIRQVILKTSFICENWANRKVFEVINQVRPKNEKGVPHPAIVVPSNIYELSGASCYNGQEHLDAMENNINSLQPVLSIHSRTSMKVTMKAQSEAIKNGTPPKMFYYRPDTLFIFKKEDHQKKGHIIEMLSQKQFNPLLSYPQIWKIEPCPSDSEPSNPHRNKPNGK